MKISHSNPGLFGVSWCAWCGQSFRSSLDDCPYCGRTRRWSQRVDGNTKKLAAVKRNRKDWTVEHIARFIDDLTEAIEGHSLDIVLGVAKVFEADGTCSLYITGAEVGEALRMAVKQYQKDRAVSRSHGV